MQSLDAQEIVLESPAAIAQLLREWVPSARRLRNGPPEAQIQPAEAAPRRGRHCACGTCRLCLDNARWERIFSEKFADPTYYGGVSVRHNSSLAGF